MTSLRHIPNSHKIWYIKEPDKAALPKCHFGNMGSRHRIRWSQKSNNAFIHLIWWKRDTLNFSLSMFCSLSSKFWHHMSRLVSHLPLPCSTNRWHEPPPHMLWKELKEDETAVLFNPYTVQQHVLSRAKCLQWGLGKTSQHSHVIYSGLTRPGCNMKLWKFHKYNKENFCNSLRPGREARQIHKIPKE